jgi:hypothetical protein
MRRRLADGLIMAIGLAALAVLLPISLVALLVWRRHPDKPQTEVWLPFEKRT